MNNNFWSDIRVYLSDNKPSKTQTQNLFCLFSDIITVSDILIFRTFCRESNKSVISCIVSWLLLSNETKDFVFWIVAFSVKAQLIWKFLMVKKESFPKKLMKPWQSFYNIDSIQTADLTLFGVFGVRKTV